MSTKPVIDTRFPDKDDINRSNYEVNLIPGAIYDVWCNNVFCSTDGHVFINESVKKFSPTYFGNMKYLNKLATDKVNTNYYSNRTKQYHFDRLQYVGSSFYPEDDIDEEDEDDDVNNNNNEYDGNGKLISTRGMWNLYFILPEDQPKLDGFVSTYKIRISVTLFAENSVVIYSSIAKKIADSSMQVIMDHLNYDTATHVQEMVPASSKLTLVTKKKTNGGKKRARKYTKRRRSKRIKSFPSGNRTRAW